MSGTSERDYGRGKGIGQHIDANRGPTGLNSGQRTIVRDEASKTALEVEEANGRGANAGKGDK